MRNFSLFFLILPCNISWRTLSVQLRKSVLCHCRCNFSIMSFFTWMISPIWKVGWLSKSPTVVLLKLVSSIRSINVCIIISVNPNRGGHKYLQILFLLAVLSPLPIHSELPLFLFTTFYCDPFLPCKYSYCCFLLLLLLFIFMGILIPAFRRELSFLSATYSWMLMCSVASCQMDNCRKYSNYIQGNFS